MKKKSYLKYKFIKKYEIDIWGYLISCSIGKKRFFNEMFKIFLFKYKRKIKLIKWFLLLWKDQFAYSTTLTKKKFVKNYKKWYIKNLRLSLIFRTYYGDMTVLKFRKYLQRVNSRKLDFISKLCFLFESRLDILLYRLNFTKNPRESRKFIKLKKVLVNGNVVSSLNYQVYINDIIYIEDFLNLKFYENLKFNLEEKKIIFNYPRYVEVNYRLIKWMFISYPKRKDIPSIWNMNFSYLRNLLN